MAPDYDFWGNRILPDYNQKWNTISFFCGNIKGRDVLGAVGIDCIPEHKISHLFESLREIDRKKAGGIALHFCLSTAENTFFKQSWIDQLLPEIKHDLLQRFSSEITGSWSPFKSSPSQTYDIVRVASTENYGNASF